MVAEGVPEEAVVVVACSKKKSGVYMSINTPSKFVKQIRATEGKKDSVVTSDHKGYI